MAIKKPIPIPIPVQEVEVIDRIYDAIEKKSRRPLRLSRLGASGIGDECIRRIWLSWRGYDTPVFNGRMLRLFETGELQEKRIIADLRLAGFAVWDTYESGLQYAFTDDTEHFVVKLDGVVKGIPGAENTPHTLEVKTHNAKSFAELEKKGAPAPVVENKAKLSPDELRSVLYGSKNVGEAIDRIVAGKFGSPLAQTIFKLIQKGKFLSDAELVINDHIHPEYSGLYEHGPGTHRVSLYGDSNLRTFAHEILHAGTSKALMDPVNAALKKRHQKCDFFVRKKT